MSTEKKGEGEPGSIVQSVARAAALLECFIDESQGLRLSELARRTSLNISTTHRLLQTLVASGFVSRSENPDIYVLGPVAVQLARTAFTAGGFPEALDILEQLVARTGESASLGVRDRNSIVVLLRSESDQLLRFDRPIGTRVQISTSAMGRSLLAFGPHDAPDAVRALGPLQSMTEHSITAARALEQELRTVRRQGFAVITDEQYVGLRSVGAPVLGPNGMARAAVAIQGPVARVADELLPAIADAVMGAANELAKIPQLEVLTSSFLTARR